MVEIWAAFHYSKTKTFAEFIFWSHDFLRSQTRVNQIKGVDLQESQSMLLKSNSYFTELIVLKCRDKVKHLGLEKYVEKN